MGRWPTLAPAASRAPQCWCGDRCLAALTAQILSELLHLRIDVYAYQAHNRGMAIKTERFAVRLTAEQDALIRRAAEVEGTDLTNFTVTATLAHARDVLADRRLFTLDDSAWKEFLALLERPMPQKPRLVQLFAEKSMFDAPQ